jgi:hypothetical protein
MILIFLKYLNLNWKNLQNNKKMDYYKKVFNVLDIWSDYNLVIPVICGIPSIGLKISTIASHITSAGGMEAVHLNR